MNDIMNNKPDILFFARDYQAKLFPKLKSENYNSHYVVLTRKEKNYLCKCGEDVKFCFEDYVDKYQSNSKLLNYEFELTTSLYSDRFWNKYNLQTRKKLLNIEYLFWNEVFDYYKPIAIINEVIAVEHAEVLYIVATEKNVQYWGWIVSPFKDRQFYWLSTPFNSTLSDEVLTNKITEDSIIHSKEYILGLKTNYSKPYYAINQRKWISLKNLLFIIGNILYKTTQWIVYRQSTSDFLHDYYNRSTFTKVKAEWSKLATFCKYFLYRNIYIFPDSIEYQKIVYPLHYEPEATLRYFAEFYQDQEYVILNISKLLGKNQILIVKEHPQQPGTLLQHRFQNILKKTSNVFYMNAEYPTKEIINKADLVITIASSMGWEGLILGKKVAVLGNVFYDKHPSVYKFNGNWDELKIKVRNLDFSIPTEEENEKYVAKVWSNCQLGLPYIHKQLYLKENIDKIRQSIENKIITYVSTLI
jgi:hypothetical protein